MTVALEYREPGLSSCPSSAALPGGQAFAAELMDSVCLVCQGKLEEALRAFDALVQLHPQSPRARYGKAQVRPSSSKLCWLSSQVGLHCPHVLCSDGGRPG